MPRQIKAKMAGDVEVQSEEQQQELLLEEENTEQAVEHGEQQDPVTEEKEPQTVVDDTPPWAKNLVENVDKVNRKLARVEEQQQQYVPNYGFGAAPAQQTYNQQLVNSEIPNNEAETDASVQYTPMQMAQAVKEVQKQEQWQQYELRQQQKFNNSIKDGLDTIADFDEKVNKNPVFNNPVIQNATKHLDNPKEVLYYLATEGKDDLNDILSSPIDVEQAKKLFEVSFKLKMEKKKVTKAAPPPTQTKNDVTVETNANGSKGSSKITELRRKRIKNKGGNR